MPTNPLYKTNDSPNNQTQPTKAVNRQSVYVPRTHNTFDMSYHFYTTQRFGFYHPFFVMEGVPGDVIPFSSEQEIRSLPMKSPYMGDLKMMKDYFLVSNQAIQPNSYEYIFRQPAQGDDVPGDAYNLFRMFYGFTNDCILKNIFIDFNEAIDDLNNRAVLEYLLILELFCSSGSLLHNLGYKVSPMVKTMADGQVYSFDQFFDKFISSMDGYTISVNNDYVNFTYTDGEIDRYTFISLLRRYGSDATFDYSIEILSDFAVEVSNLPVITPDRSNEFINMDRLCAYQLACWQYYVNPQVDFIYNAQLWRDNLLNLASIATGLPINIGTFDLNGIQIPYDRCSLYSYEQVLNELNDSGLDGDFRFYDYFHALFGYNESLRFGDYFTDSRTQPLAVGNDLVSTVNGGSAVSVIDMSQSIIFQRFRNAVIKLGNNFGDYLRGIFGTDTTPDYHIPKFIVHQEFGVNGFEVANTAGDTGKLVNNLKTTDGQYAFEVEVSMPCVIIGISSFSIPRSYSQTKERFFFHKDRFDFFNTMLQQYGDQAVFNDERTDSRPNNEIFGYQSRYNEYKQRYSHASGAFVSGNQLSSWLFVTDSLFDPFVDISVSNTQSPDFIRAHDYEFNRFFAAMPGYSLANGFHFLVKYNNQCVCNRPMEINPSTL